MILVKVQIRQCGARIAVGRNLHCTKLDMIGRCTEHRGINIKFLTLNCSMVASETLNGNVDVCV